MYTSSSVPGELETPWICSLVARLYTGCPTSAKQGNGKVTGWARRLCILNNFDWVRTWYPNLELGLSLQRDGEIEQPGKFSSLGHFDMVVPNAMLKETFLRRKLIRSVCDPLEIKSWIKYCHDAHGHVVSASRAMDALTKAGIFHLLDTRSLYFHTVHTDERNSIRYAALSYVWGQSKYPPPSPSPTEVIGLDLLAPTLRDTILLARTLDIPYVWIDQICVDRSSEQNFYATLANMGSIYEAAEIVIVAACGDSADVGLPGSPLCPRQGETLVATIHNDDDKQWGLTPLGVHQTPGNLLEGQPWSRRAWTFQEYASATRSLIVLPHEMLYICHAGMRREAYVTDDPPENFKEPPTQLYSSREKFDRIRQAFNSSDLDVLFEGYSEAVELYSSRELTFELDRLNAFSGFISKIAPGDKVAALSGIPLSLFGSCLAWEIVTFLPYQTPVPLKNEARPRISQVAPSWSWISAPYRTGYGFSNHGETPPFHYEAQDGTDGFGRPNEAFWRSTLMNRTKKLLDIPSSNHILGSRSIIPTDLPRIHLMTIVFKAKLKAEGRFNKDLRYYHFARQRHHPHGLEIWGDTFVVDGEIPSKLNNRKRDTFAVVWTPRTRYLEYCIFLLRQVEDYYERVSSAMISDEAFFTMINAAPSDARWKWIELR